MTVMETEPPTVLPPHYYRDNFLSLCETVERQYGDLLNPEELSLLRRFGSLGFEAQCLYIRLVSRVGPWFREARLDYPELGGLAPLLDELLAGELALLPRALSVDELGSLYTRQELLTMFQCRQRGLKSQDKASLLGTLDALALEPGELLDMAREFDGARVVAPAGTDCVQLIQLLFFGNRRQGMTDFVLSDLGLARYYPYRLDRKNRLFPGRQALDEYLGCAFYSDCWYEHFDAGDTQAMVRLGGEMLAVEILFPTSEQRWHRLCNTVARELERRGEAELALGLYRRSLRHPARERQVRILEAGGDYRAAMQLCETIQGTPWCEEEYEAAGRILPRVKRKLYGAKSPRRRDDFPTLKLVLSRNDERVETRVAEHLGGQWRAVRYVENHLMNALFGLAFWEQIFAPLPGAFHNAYQSAPADMYEPSFRLRREPALEVRLRELAQCDLREELSSAYRRYYPCQCRWVNWRYIDRELVEVAAAIIPPAHLLAIWQRMLFDPGENRRGFPDLVALGAERGDYCLIEVKGPGDALQDSQKRWLRFFGQHDIPASVAWVEWERESD